MHAHAHPAAGAVVLLRRRRLRRGAAGAQAVQRAGRRAAHLRPRHHRRRCAAGQAPRRLFAGHRHGGRSVLRPVSVELGLCPSRRHALPPHSRLARRRTARVGAALAAAHGRRFAGHRRQLDHRPLRFDRSAAQCRSSTTPSSSSPRPWPCWRRPPARRPCRFSPACGRKEKRYEFANERSRLGFARGLLSACSPPRP